MENETHVINNQIICQPLKNINHFDRYFSSTSASSSPPLPSLSTQSPSPIYLTSPPYSPPYNATQPFIFNSNQQPRNNSEEIVSNALPFYFGTPYLNTNTHRRILSSPSLNYMPMVVNSSNDQLYMQNLISALYTLASCQQQFRETNQQHQIQQLNFSKQSINQIHSYCSQPHKPSPQLNALVNNKKTKIKINQVCNSTIEINEQVDEHFIKSLGKKYFKIFGDKQKMNNNSLSVKNIKIKRLKISNLLNNHKKIQNIEAETDSSNYKTNNFNIIPTVFKTKNDYSNNDDEFIDMNETCHIMAKKRCFCTDCQVNSQSDTNYLSSKDNNKDNNDDIFNESNFNNEIDDDETQSLILSASSSISSSRLSINTNTYFEDEEDEFINRDIDNDGFEDNSLLNNNDSHDNFKED